MIVKLEIIDINDKLYPKSLKKIHNPPKKLYVCGNSQILNSNCISIVGSRNNTEYGKKWCKVFAKGFVKYKITIVSGMAVGIDTIAHKAALEAFGKTIAVLPCGHNKIFPMENEGLYKSIVANGGCVITEYESNVEASSKRFLERNRIVSGMSFATLVVEASFRSGTSVTAKLAKEQDRDVYCIPGNLENSKSKGTNNLIKEFAKIAISPNDIVENYDFIGKTIIEMPKECEMKFNWKVENYNIPKEYRNLFNVLTNVPQTVDELAKKTGEEIKSLMPKLTMLEIDGKIKQISGKRYIRGE